MAQYLKDEVRERITGAALETFAREGFERATMAAIARGAGISTGNLYRYFDGKESLFGAVVPDAFVSELCERLGLRLRRARGVEDYRTLPAEHPYLEAAQALLDFAIRDRLRVVIVLGRAQGTPLAGLTAALEERMVAAAFQNYRAADAPVDESLELVVREIYHNYLTSLVAILARLERAEEIRTAVESYQRYHLVGLRALLGA